MNKNTITEPSMNDWKKLYETSINFKNLKCWEWMYDSNIFGVMDPDSGEIGYCSVMGKSGEFFALSIYLGYEGLKSFWDILKNPYSSDNLFMQKCLMLSFEDRDYLQKKDLDLIKKLGLKFRGRNQWIMFRSYMPGYYPWYLTKEEALFMNYAISQAIEVGKRFKKDQSLLLPPKNISDEYLVRVPHKKNEKLIWKDELLKPKKKRAKSIKPLTIDEIRLKKLLSKAKQGNEAWELDINYYNTPIQDKKNERPYLPKMCLLIDQKSTMILSSELCVPWNYLHDSLENILQTIEHRKVIPETIMVTNEVLHKAFKDIIKKLGIDLVKVKHFIVADQVKHTLNTIANPSFNSDISLEEIFQNDIPEEFIGLFKDLMDD